MVELNVSCPVCKVAFKNSDSVYSTSCGHIFHFLCMNNWRCTNNRCPVCLCYDPTTHVIYLTLEDGREYENVVNDLNAKLERSKEEFKQIQEEKKKKDVKIDDIKRLYNISEQWRAELEDKIYKLNHDSQIQNQNHAKEMNSKLDEIQLHKTHIETLEEQEGVVNLFQKINEFSSENSKLKKKLEDSEISQMILKQKIEMQEQRLKHVTSELQKQFAESFNQEIERESCENINLLPLHNQIEFDRRTKSNGNRRVRDSRKVSVEGRNAMDISNKNTDAKQSKESKLFHLTHPNDSKVIIVNYPKDNIVYPLKDTVILLASKMAISFTAEDILNVSIIDPRKFSRTTSLTVEFKTMDAKILFLTNRNRLRFDPSTKSIALKEYIDEAIYPIFMYANRKLRGNGYEFVCCKDNKVIARKKLNDSEEIVIKSKAHVDSLLMCQSTSAIDINKYPKIDLYDNLFLGFL